MSKIKIEISVCTLLKTGILLVAVLICVFIGYCFLNGAMDVEEVKDSVVMVEVYGANEELFATGSGFCAYKENWIATNFHVIEGAKSIKIITDAHEKITIDRIVFFNKKHDVAILSHSGSLKPLKFGDSSKIKTKDKVTTIGSPKGELNTVSEGIISNADDKDMIRITAPISHGSSGGVLLNHKNEVIGITSAGYDDAQNLNFAIDIAVLESFYDKYEQGKSVSIKIDSLPKYIGSLDNFGDYLQSDSICYKTPSLALFYALTNNEARFQKLLDKDSPWLSWYVFKSDSEKKAIVDFFMELNIREFDDKNVKQDIAEWDAADFLISLGVLNRYEYAMVAADIENCSDKDKMFARVESYPLDAAEKALILYLIGKYDWSEIHTDNKKDIFDYFDAKYGTEDLGAILEVLGYDVEYESDGTLTAYW